MALSETTKDIIKSTVPLLRTHGIEIVQTFYQTLFTRYPAVKRQFNPTNSTSIDGEPPKQVKALANAVLLYARRIDDLPPLIPLLKPICEKHVSRGVSMEQYDAVGECLLVAIKEVLGDAAGDDVLEAWVEAYGVLKDVFIRLEEEIRRVHEVNAGWKGMNELPIQSADDVEDGRALRVKVSGVRDCAPGMFISVSVNREEEESMTSLKIIEVRSDGFSILVEYQEEQATEPLMRLSEGDKIWISVPCGKPKS